MVAETRPAAPQVMELFEVSTRLLKFDAPVEVPVLLSFLGVCSCRHLING